MTWDKETVNQNMDGLELAATGDGCGFSWAPCDLCERDLGGDRHEVAVLNQGADADNLQVCADCLHYVEYGTIPE